MRKKDYKAANKKREKTLIEKYGVPFNSQRKEVKEILANVQRNKISNNSRELLDDDKLIIDLYQNKKRSIRYIAKKMGVHDSTIKLRLKELNLEFHSGKIGENSSEEIEIAEFLDSIGVRYTMNRYDILPKSKAGRARELDFLIEHKGKKLAIEHCGIYYHSTKYKEDKSCHYSKYIDCTKLGIELLTIYSDEWDSRNHQVKEFIKSKLGIFDKRIYARQCKFKVLDKVPLEFLDETHIQGHNAASSFASGLYYNNELVGVTTYNRINTTENDKVELNRLSFKNGVQVIGGPSKLIKNSIKEFGFSFIKTLSDNRYTNGLMYSEIGFSLVKKYHRKNSFLDASDHRKRITYEDKRIKNIKRENNETVVEAAERLGYYPIYDCGKKRWELKVE
jgi:hypothetical protein